MNPIYINLGNLSLKQQEEFLDGFKRERKTTNNPNLIHIDASQITPKQAIELIEKIKEIRQIQKIATTN